MKVISSSTEGATELAFDWARHRAVTCVPRVLPTAGFGKRCNQINEIETYQSTTQSLVQMGVPFGLTRLQGSPHA